MTRDGGEDLREQDDSFRRLIELTYHPAFDELSALLRVQLPQDLNLLFELSAATINAQPALWFPAAPKPGALPS